jgi:hypothetical protein
VGGGGRRKERRNERRKEADGPRSYGKRAWVEREREREKARKIKMLGG